MRVQLLVAFICIALGAMAQQSDQQLSTSHAADRVAVSTTDELTDLFRMAVQQGITDGALQMVYLTYESDQLRQYAKFTFDTAVFMQLRTSKNEKGFDEIDHWVVTAGLDGDLQRASHDHLVEDQAVLISMDPVPSTDEEAVTVARGIIDRFLGHMRSAGIRPHSGEQHNWR